MLSGIAAMNAVLFGAKRVFLSSVAVTRRVLRAIAPGMTAARYDMMYAIAWAPRRGEFCESERGIRQSDVRRALGVSAPVVSRMVRSLVELGWVKRFPRSHGADKRQRWLGLTKEGAAQMRAAFRMAGRFVKRLVYRALCHHGLGRRVPRFIAMGEMEGRLNWVRSACGDTATLWYWWPSPDD